MDMMCSRQDMNRAEAKRKAQSSSVVPMTLGAASAVAFADSTCVENEDNTALSLSPSLVFLCTVCSFLFPSFFLLAIILPYRH